MSIDWAALGQVFGVTLVVTVGIVGLFTVGIVGTARPRQEGAAATAGAPSTGARIGGLAAYAVCAAAVAYGLYLIVAA
ncbi:hypothetical protein [Streptomyces benahoarensis]|uniref:Uncharacterized protein n=1 Tax=Streptomyces benahoarensis TaxID=2595054 RepID=A0A553Y4V3_9ACTN|nr:hypothetical protein [Streptomyces benahoarensis]TSB15274.1 hypothetical protein FNJ62_28820 [Streptomyces benahoarensis]TSB24073.1 hypothetical protein FNZ23_27405 [Streptomyces benahoarensis]